MHCINTLAQTSSTAVHGKIALLSVVHTSHPVYTASAMLIQNCSDSDISISIIKLQGGSNT
jgi:ribosomal protein L31